MDNAPELNLAPRQRVYGYDPVVPPSSSTDPFVTHLAPRQIERDDDEPAPQVYIGPPRDEDGHELHNVII